MALAGGPGARVSVSLVWGTGPGDRQTIPVPALTARYATVPLKFTAGADTSDGRLEIVGTGSGTFRVGVASLMPADNVSGFKAASIRYLKELGIEIARWPGGNFVSAYDWRDGIGDRDRRPPRRELAWSGLESNDMGIDDFMTFCRLIGATPYLAVNSGLGDAHSAAEEVEYVNGPATSRLGRLRAANGHPAPYGVKIWGVGNEMYGPWQWGHMLITQYAEKHNLIVRAMRKVDPTIEVIASGATPEEASWCYIENRQLGTFPERETLSEPLPFAFGSSQDWTGALLKASADHIDYLGEHFYGYPNLVIDPASQQFVLSDEPMELKVRRLSNRVQFKFEAWDGVPEAVPPPEAEAHPVRVRRVVAAQPGACGRAAAGQPPDAQPADERSRLPRVLPPLRRGGPRRRDRWDGDAGERLLRRRDRAAPGGAGDEAAARPLRGRSAGGRERRQRHSVPRRGWSESTPRRALPEVRRGRSTCSRPSPPTARRWPSLSSIRPRRRRSAT